MDNDGEENGLGKVPKPAAAPRSGGDARRERLAAQLKANLKRRKQQARGRSDAEGEPG